MDLPVETPATPEEQEALFQAIILKMSSVANPAKLEQLSLLALDLMLRRPFDQDLRGALRRRVGEVIAEVKPEHSSDVQRNEMRSAARGCIEVLRAAKEQRLPRSVTDNWAQHKDGKFHLPPHHVTEEEKEEGRGLKIAVAVLVLLTLSVGGYILWTRSQTPVENTGSEADRFVAQIVDSAQGNPPPSHLFGGPIRVTSMNGVPVVIAEQVPPRICSASGMKLVKKGLLSVNGNTPTRVSSAIITELCNKEGGGDATLMWAPK
ncbi:hypothetical protein CCC_01239 [Paramagnetospirillum magnetotacticum MS-1]|uniref:Uncharacterized protein n=1 Tax=Paramagnetospirillum magnetotacticum MS-1 TaxID=272627 RepID=A0A0C2YSS1_PARME|nr:hypothetical protein [Paramagnetospirillum magnetotacticum]KIL98178.1 hypothetical protein CCC_01239 [Paramagnetospirillum magnetotacticum MS-1]